MPRRSIRILGFLQYVNANNIFYTQTFFDIWHFDSHVHLTKPCPIPVDCWLAIIRKANVFSIGTWSTVIKYFWRIVNWDCEHKDFKSPSVVPLNDNTHQMSSWNNIKMIINNKIWMTYFDWDNIFRSFFTVNQIEKVGRKKLNKYLWSIR